MKDNPTFAADLKTVSENLPTLYLFWDLIPENIFEIPASDRTNKILTSVENTKSNADAFKQKNNNTLIIYHMIQHGGILELAIDEETFLKIIDRYFIVKSERNDSVHARRLPKKLIGGADSAKSYAKILKAYMKEGLQEYSAVITRFKGDKNLRACLKSSK